MSDRGPLVRGDTREDGYRFIAYVKSAKGYREHWASPEAWEKRVAKAPVMGAIYRQNIKKDPAKLEVRRSQIRKHVKNRRRKYPELHMLTSARRRAKNKKIEFSIDLSDIHIPKVCPVFGFPIGVQDGIHNDHSAELDRIDNDKGYVKGNVIVVSRLANRIKSNATLAQIRKLLEFYESL